MASRLRSQTLLTHTRAFMQTIENKNNNKAATSKGNKQKRAHSHRQPTLMMNRDQKRKKKNIIQKCIKVDCVIGGCDACVRVCIQAAVQYSRLTHSQSTIRCISYSFDSVERAFVHVRDLGNTMPMRNTDNNNINNLFQW